MKQRISNNDLDYFFSEYHKESPFILLLLKIISTFGIYLIWWIYRHNTTLEKVDNLALESRRGIMILLLMPPFFIMLHVVFKILIFYDNITFLTIFDMIFVALFIFLSLKYVYDFCVFFGKWTNTSGIFWFDFIIIWILLYDSFSCFKFRVYCYYAICS